MITFDLLVPANGVGPSHLRTAHTAGLVCGTRTGRKLFTMAGIVDSNASTCAACRAGAYAAERAAEREAYRLACCDHYVETDGHAHSGSCPTFDEVREDAEAFEAALADYEGRD